MKAVTYAELAAVTRNLLPLFTAGGPGGGGGGRNFSVPSFSGMVRDRQQSQKNARDWNMTNSRRMKPVVKGRKFTLTSRSAGKFKRKYKKVRRRSKVQSSAKNGVVKTLEHGGTVVDKYCCHLIHHSMPIEGIMHVCFVALAKKLIEKYFGVQIANLKQGFNEFSGALFHIDINYFPTSTSINHNTGQIIIAAGSVESVETIGQRIYDQFRAAVATYSSSEFWKIRLYAEPYGSVQRHAEINLRTLIFDIYSKSSLKIQNRSKNPLGTESDEVDNVPVYGKSYIVNGSSFLLNDRHRSTAAFFTPFVASQEHGFTAVTGETDVTGATKEPPVASYFSNCKGTQKVRIEPGTIKTSVVVFKKQVKLVDLITHWMPGMTTGATRFRNALGQSRMYSLEKIIETMEGDATPSVNIEIGFENNTQFIVSVKEKYTPMAAQLFQKI